MGRARRQPRAANSRAVAGSRASASTVSGRAQADGHRHHRMWRIDDERATHGAIIVEHGAERWVLRHYHRGGFVALLLRRHRVGEADEAIASPEVARRVALADVPQVIDRVREVLRRLLQIEALELGCLEDVGPQFLVAREQHAAAERRLVLETWNGTAAAPPPDGLLHAPIAAQAARTPDAVAVVFEDESLTYRELEARANRLARHLVRLGAGREARVGICLARGPEMVVALLAVLKAGAAYLPLDPAYPAARLAYMLDDAGAPLLVTETSLRGLLAGDGARIVLVDGDADAIAGEAAEAPRSSVVPQNAAYVIYTSGSTGRPKAVAIQHASAAALLRWAEGAYSSGELAGVLAATSVCFDLSVFELFVTLTRGGAVVMAENALRLVGMVQLGPRPDRLAERVRRALGPLRPQVRARGSAQRRRSGGAGDRAACRYQRQSLFEPAFRAICDRPAPQSPGRPQRQTSDASA